ncbi:MAG: hypothetical protein CMD28_05455 [Flavobacteriales bacterium]|nr:hypothetical protein [Flavobacteriales bacterium]
MNLTVMQPYLFAYIGYWQLINAVDIFVIYDDVNFIKRGHINRNTFLQNQKPQLFTLELVGASQNKKINEIDVGNNSKKLLKTIRQNYSKAPFFTDVFPVLEEILNNGQKELSKFLGSSLVKISKYLNIETKFLYSSDIKNDKALKAQDRLIEISKTLNATSYINSIGGIELYDKSVFSQNDINLSFLKTYEISYKQFNNEFVPNLSIVDILMFSSKDNIKNMLNHFQLI